MGLPVIDYLNERSVTALMSDHTAKNIIPRDMKFTDFNNKRQWVMTCWDVTNKTEITVPMQGTNFIWK